MTQKLTTKEVIINYKKVHGNRYDYSEVEYIDNKTKVEIICKKHGSFWQTPSDHKSGNGCQKCKAEKIGNLKRSTIKEFIVKARLIFGDLYDYSEFIYINAYTKGKIICKKHGVFLQRPSDHLGSQAGCPKCANEKTAKAQRYTTKEIIIKYKKVHGNRYDYSEVEYINAHTKVKITCKKHGSFQQISHEHLQGQGCPSCSHHISKPQQKLYNYLKRRLPNTEIIMCDRKLLNGKELDIYIPSKKLAIEVDGIYWHSEQFGFTKNKHLEKTLECQKHRVTLLHFWDDEIKEKFGIVTSIIRSKLGFNKRIFARKCEIRKIEDKKAALKFINTYHLQGGKAGFTVGYGLYTISKDGIFPTEELLGVMTFGIPRFSKEFDWEIVRLAFKTTISITGGVSKLFKAFIRENNPSNIVTYADLRISTGNVYKQIGFEFSHYSSSNYFYTGYGYKIPRIKAQKHKLQDLLGEEKFDINKTELENMEFNGYSRVFDCGNAVFHWKLIC